MKRQFEQILNAMYLDKLEYGEFHLELDKESIEKFLSNQEYYREKIQSGFKHDRNQAIFDALDEIIEELT